jgi:hypothetical protein
VAAILFFKFTISHPPFGLPPFLAIAIAVGGGSVLTRVSSQITCAEMSSHRFAQDLTFDGFRLANPVGRLRGDLFHDGHALNDFAEGWEPPAQMENSRMPSSLRDLRRQLNPASNDGTELFNHCYLQTLGGKCQLDTFLSGFELDYNTLLVLHRNY